MKKLIIIGFLISSILSHAQSFAEHKTYQGEFDNGKATYTYLPSPTGERIFDGPFKFTHPMQTYQGHFKDNHQVGLWTLVWTHPDAFPGKPIKRITTINFNDEGYVDGNLKIQEFYANGKIVEVVDATYRNGRLNGPFNATFTEGERVGKSMSGQYIKGRPAGLWEYSWVDAPVDFDKADWYGNVEVTRISKSTGDITKSFESMPTEPFLMGKVVNHLQMRDSRIISFRPKLSNQRMDDFRKSIIWEGGSEKPIGFEGSNEQSYHMNLIIPDSLYDRNFKNFRENWSEWDDFILRNCSLTGKEIGDEPVFVNLLIEVDTEGNIKLLEDDETVSKKLNEEILRLLKMLKWDFGPYNTFQEKPKPNTHVYCEVWVKYDTAKMTEVNERYSELKRQEEEKQLARKRYEESLRPVSVESTKTDVSDNGGTSDIIYDEVDEQPQFPDGLQGLMRFISENLKYPEAAQQSDIQGKVVVRFVVSTDGSIRDVKVLKGVHPDLDKEAMRVVYRLPKFKPAMLNGQPVSTYYTLPLNFRLNN